MKLAHFFIPHPETHKKAYLISTKAFLVYIALFLVLQLSFQTISKVNPGVLGVASNINQSELIRLTNEERKKQGLSEVTEDPRLNAAAEAKARNMFEENYWAHYSPSGKDPWGFINGAGYRFSYAGENLARNFYNSDEVVVAWMNSPSHRDNLLNSHYTNIGIAVVNGVLDGEETTLVVQEFGKPVEAVALKPTITTPELAVNSVPAATAAPSAAASLAPSSAPQLAQVAPVTSTLAETSVPSQPVRIDQFKVTKTVGLSVIALIAVLLLADYFILRKRAVIRLGSHHLPHFALLSVASVNLISLSPGVIL